MLCSEIEPILKVTAPTNLLWLTDMFTLCQVESHNATMQTMYLLSMNLCYFRLIHCAFMVIIKEKMVT